MAMLVLLDSNFRATFRFGSQQLLPVFSEMVQSKVRGAADRMSLVSQVSYFMKSSPPNAKVALIFGSFENMLTGRRSEIQHFPKAVIRFEVESYAQMLRDLLGAHPSVSVFFAPLFRSQPTWYESNYGEILDLFCSIITHVDPARVKVVPHVDISTKNLDPAGVHFDKVVQQLVVTQLLSSFLDGFFVDPQQYPLIDIIGYLINIFLSFLIICSSYYIDPELVLIVS